MSRTVKGYYRLRAKTQRKYLSSGTFSTVWSTDKAGEPGAGWTNNLAAGTKVGDNDDSTYASIVPPAYSLLSQKHKGWNSILTTSAVTKVPEFDYDITSVVSYVKWWGSDYYSATTRQGRIWTTLYDSRTNSSGTTKKTDSYLPSASKLAVYYSRNGSFTTSVATYSATTAVSASYSAKDYPDSVALCMSGCRALGYTLSNLYCSEVYHHVYYSYVENEETATLSIADGVTVSSSGESVSAGSLVAYRHTTYDFTATLDKGYELDGWYLNGTKVSSDLTYSYELYDADVLECVAVKTGFPIYVGTRQVTDIYVGTTPVKAVYLGTEELS